MALVAVNSTPPALRAAPDAFSVVASLFITLGSLIVATALCLPGNKGRLVVEQLGLTLFGFGLLSYGVAVIHLNGWDRARLPASFCFGSALGSFATYAKLWWYQRKPWRRR